MTENTAKKAVPEIGKQPQMVDAAMIPLEIIGELMDILRDTPIPHKVSNPMIQKLQTAPVGKFPLEQLMGKAD